MKDLLVEIGCEDLPPRSIRPAFEQLGADAERLFKELRLAHERIYTTGTTRRLVLYVSRLASIQSAVTETVTGPPMSKSFDEHGKPTQAAVGFAKSHGVAVSQLKTIKTDKGDYIGYARKLERRRTTVLLKDHVARLVAGLKFPKVMRWEAGGFRFARPIRWLVCLYGETPIRFAVAGVRAGNISRTIPWLRRERIVIRNAKLFARSLAKAGVILDHEERLRKIEKQARAAAARLRLELVEDPELFDELNFMLENPRVFVGNFDEKYLDLPPEVVVTAMKAHQRYAALRDKRHRLVPKFLSFSEGGSSNLGFVRRGNERVLRARLEDALFYWREDLKQGIDGLARKLGGIVFIEGLGSVKEKAERLYKIAAMINDAGPDGGRVSDEKIRRAALLAKADLASEMVKDGKEFTRLEGLIGGRYASNNGEGEDVVIALREQYQPRSPSDPLPQTPLGELLSIADRVDTIVGCFIAGLVPTGSQDPYALRRLSNGLLRIVERRLELDIESLIETSYGAYVEGNYADEADRTRVLGALREFMRARFEMYLKEKGVLYDVVDAVASISWARPGVGIKRSRAIQSMRGDGSFERLITGVKRVGNILTAPLKVYGADWGALERAFLGSGEFNAGIRFSTDLFYEEAEKLLYERIKRAIPPMIAEETRSDFQRVLATLATLGPPIDTYFDKVLVNCKDEALRRNRHHFLAAVFALFSKYADFSQIVEVGTAAGT